MLLIASVVPPIRVDDLFHSTVISRIHDRLSAHPSHCPFSPAAVSALPGNTPLSSHLTRQLGSKSNRNAPMNVSNSICLGALPEMNRVEHSRAVLPHSEPSNRQMPAEAPNGLSYASSQRLRSHKQHMLGLVATYRGKCWGIIDLKGVECRAQEWPASHRRKWRQDIQQR